MALGAIIDLKNYLNITQTLEMTLYKIKKIKIRMLSLYLCCDYEFATLLYIEKSFYLTKEYSDHSKIVGYLVIKYLTILVVI